MDPWHCRYSECSSPSHRCSHCWSPALHYGAAWYASSRGSGSWVLGLRISVRGTEHLPDGSCVVVANHASYLDGVVLKAVLPPRFSFVIKREAADVSGGGVAAAADRLGVRRPRQPRRPPERCATRGAPRGGGPFARLLSRGHICRGTGAAPISHRRLRSRSARAAAGRAGGDPRCAPRDAERRDHPARRSHRRRNPRTAAALRFASRCRRTAPRGAPPNTRAPRRA